MVTRAWDQHRPTSLRAASTRGTGASQEERFSWAWAAASWGGVVERVWDSGEAPTGILRAATEPPPPVLHIKICKITIEPWIARQGIS